MRHIIQKIYYKIEFVLESSLAIGSGQGTTTDSDIIVKCKIDENGNLKEEPYIPATALAGIYRQVLGKKKMKNSQVKMADHYFGCISKSENEKEESKISVYDGNLLPAQKFVISHRDCVALDEWKVAKDGSKFDFEVLEPGVTFVTYIEQNLAENDEDVCAYIAKEFALGNFQLGAKTSRGYGQVISKMTWRKKFDLKKDVDKWLDFDMYSDKCWEPNDEFKPLTAVEAVCEDEAKPAFEEVWQFDLAQKGGIDIRTYTTKVSKDANVEADYLQITYADGFPLIPGTSWAGCFRHDMENMINDMSSAENKKELKAELDRLFGFVGSGSSSAKQKALFTFGESRIVGENGAIPKSKVITRNAIDRFTGGAVGKALFTEKMYYGGRTKLIVKLKKTPSNAMRSLFIAAVMDLNYGIMAVGGLTSIGRGLFEITAVKCNGINIYTAGEGHVLSYEALMSKEGEAL